jgi:hypothetical protein
MEVEEKLTALEKHLKEKEEKAQEIERQSAVTSYKAEQKAHVLSKASEYILWPQTKKK